jgi:hypothetical protein
VADSRLETTSRGSISLLAPYGEVAIGSGLARAGAGGVVTRRGGDLQIYADGDVALGTSRAFTLQGGDITIWTTHGSITAGSGSQTSVVKIAPAYAMDIDGVVTLDLFGLQTGSGIGILDAFDGAGDVPKSSMDLIALNGEVNSGDAGIRVHGDLNIAALRVSGLDNIQVSGRSAGVPSVEPPSASILTAASQAATAGSQDVVGAGARKLTPEELPSIISVEVVGYEDPAAAGPVSPATAHPVQVLGHGPLDDKQLEQLTPEERAAREKLRRRDRR